MRRVELTPTVRCLGRLNRELSVVASIAQGCRCASRTYARAVDRPVERSAGIKAGCGMYEDLRFYEAVAPDEKTPIGNSIDCNAFGLDA